MRGTHRTSWIAVAVVLGMALVVTAQAAETFRDEAMLKCVEGGGIYYDDGHCEGGSAGEPPPKAEPEVPKAVPDTSKSDPGVQYGDEGDQKDAETTPDDEAAREEAARKECKRKGGRYLSDGTCDRRDPITRCEDSGGMFMVNGQCFHNYDAPIPQRRRR
jgi:hypothetical protein